jgi:tetratricopeptide (TPR) repeat protein
MRTPFEQALAQFLCHRGDPLALARRAEGVAGRLLEASLLLCSRGPREFEAAGWVYAGLMRHDLNCLDGAYRAAIAAALDGELARACRIYDEILAERPGELLALAVAHVFDHFLGNAKAMRARTSQVMRAVPAHHAVLSMNAFALQECGEYAAAEAAARRALELEPRDLRAHHAVTHVLEMQGRFAEGVRWMGERSALWAGGGSASTHLWWHLALHHLELGRPEHALAIHDRRIQGEGLPELIDASALLWRLHLSDVDAGERFAVLAARWAPHAEDAHCAFNDLHAMMAFVAAGRWDCADRLLHAQARRVARHGGTNRDMTRLVGLPACSALAAFGRGDYSRAESLLRALPPVAHRIGGSHAQRDVLHLTRAAAAERLRRRRAWRRAA